MSSAPSDDKPRTTHDPPPSFLRVLIVEDNPADALLCTEALNDYELGEFETDVVTTLEEALSSMKSLRPDAVLLDLSLPDSEGLDSVSAIVARNPDTPVIVSTGFEEKDHGVAALSLGASDFLQKSELGPAVLGRAIVYAVERQKLKTELELASSRNAREMEFEKLTEISSLPGTDITARSFLAEPFQAALPDHFEDLVESYTSVISDARQERRVKVDLNVSGRLHEISEVLGIARAGPRDVVDLHMAAMKRHEGQLDREAFRIESREARFLLIEILGNLVTFYRNTTERVRKGQSG